MPVKDFQTFFSTNQKQAGMVKAGVPEVNFSQYRASRGVFEAENILRRKEYRILGKKGEGTFSEVLKCQNTKDGTYWACKKMKQHYDSLEQVNNLREIQAMRRLSPNANILELQEVIFDKKSGVLVLICELMDMNIYELIRGRRHYLPEPKVKNFMYQLCKSIEHMHRNGIFHRDVKPENILVKDDILKLADFGSCRSVYSKQPYTEYISTRWYRAPECLLTDGYYTYKMDNWSVGCVFFEVLSLHPLFPGSNEVDQIAKIHDIIGTPDPAVLNKLRNKTRGMNFNFPPKKGSGIERLLPHASKEAIDLIYKLCTYDPDERLTSKQSVRHPYFKELRDAEKRQAAQQKAQQRPDDVIEKVDSTLQVTENAKSEPNSQDETKDKDTKAAQESVVGPLLTKPTLGYERRRRRRQKRVTDNGYQHGSYLPKVNGTSSQFSSSIYPSTTSFPKINGSSMFPSIGAFKSKPKANTQPQTNKNMYGHYQLPSIDRRGGQF
ncbi:MAPK/MAK/MRK overlapping kinase-like isoform X2 [Lineus longissimus]|uniref:MAPK/MAK/MRK overlapping kinase-like isoform X2 n=1 Tax=Lineus longissimus TaxID=88925 RepID=UPI00315C6CD2